MSKDNLKLSLASLNGRPDHEWAIMPTLSFIQDYRKRITIHVMDTAVSNSPTEFMRFRNIPLTEHAHHQHGTSTAAIICGKTTGILPSDDNVKWYTISRTPDSILEELLKVKATITQAKKTASRIQRHAHVLMINWQIAHNTPLKATIEDTIKQLIKLNVEVYVAAGNAGTNEVIFPCGIDGITLVGAHDYNGIINLFNNTADKIDIFAPGRKVSVPKAGTNSEWIEQDGNSLAVAAVVAARCYFESKDDMLNHAMTGSLNWRNKADYYLPNKRLFIGDCESLSHVPSVEYGNTKMQLVDGKMRIVHDWEYEDDPEFDNKTYVDLCVEHINNTMHGEVLIPMSGGLDSEFVMYCALRANITPVPVIMRYTDYEHRPLNEYDYKYAVEYCSKHGMQARIYDAPIAELFDRGAYWRFGATYCSTSPQLAAHLWLLSKIKMQSIMPGDPVNYHGGSGISVQPYEYYCYDRYFSDTKRLNCIPRLHTANGKIVRKGIEITMQVSALEANQKAEWYKLAGMQDFVRRPKYTGFEEVREYYDKYHSTANYFNKKFRRPLGRIHGREQEFFYKGRVEPRES